MTPTDGKPEPTDQAASDHDAIRRQLRRILLSPQFASSERLKQFLEYVVEQALAGAADQLKEYTVALQVYQRGDDFDPREDSIVRTEASRLRARLRGYYDQPGTEGELRIGLPRGRYVPEFMPPASAERPGAAKSTGRGDTQRQIPDLRTAASNLQVRPARYVRGPVLAAGFALLVWSIV